MYYNEELLSDEGDRRLNGNQQYELIAKYCHDIEERIHSASSRLEALQIAETACTHIQQTCQSSLIKEALVSYVEELISRYWNGHGPDKGSE